MRLAVAKLLAASQGAPMQTIWCVQIISRDFARALKTKSRLLKLTTVKVASPVSQAALPTTSATLTRDWSSRARFWTKARFPTLERWARTSDANKRASSTLTALPHQKKSLLKMSLLVKLISRYTMWSLVNSRRRPTKEVLLSKRVRSFSMRRKVMIRSSRWAACPITVPCFPVKRALNKLMEMDEDLSKVSLPRKTRTTKPSRHKITSMKWFKFFSNNSSSKIRTWCLSEPTPGLRALTTKFIT